jgi:hypothetical protein
MQDGVVDVASSSMPMLKNRALIRVRTPTFEKEIYHSFGEVSYGTIEEAIFAISYQRVLEAQTVKELLGVLGHEDYRKWSKFWSRARRLVPWIGRPREEDVMNFITWGSEEELWIDDPRSEQDAIARYAAGFSVDDLGIAPSKLLPQTDLNARPTEEAPSFHIQRLGPALRLIFTYLSQEHEVGHPTRWQAPKAPSPRELADSFIILYWIVVTGSVCLAVFVDLIFRIAYSTFASSGHQTTSPPLYGSATNASYGHRLILSVLYDSATTAILLTLAFSKTLLVLPAVLLYYMGAGAIRQELIFWGRILFGAYGESAGFDECMKMWAFSVKSLGRPRLTPGHRRVEWKCVSVAGIPDLEHPSLTM